MDIKNIQKITVDFYNNKIIFIRAKQYDKKTRYLIVSCTNNGTFIKFNPEDTICNLKMLTPDNRAIYNEEVINEDGTILVEFTESMLCSAGKGKIELNMLSKDYSTLISTMTIDIIIEPSVYDNDKVISSDEYNILDKIIIDGKKLILDLTTLETTLEENEEDRQRNEEDRQRNEENRQRDENVRKSNETARQSQETSRENAENLRESNTATAITNANTATSNANVATSNANEATTKANTATDAAKTATSNANTATNQANNAIAEMNRLMQDNTLVHKDLMGVADGVATLDGNGKVIASQLPSFVDEVLEGTAQGVTVDSQTGSQTATGFILTGETKVCTPEKGKLYVDPTKNITYRWSGTIYVSVGGGTVTGIVMNGVSKGIGGIIDLGTVITGGSQTTTSTADGGTNVYTFSDGSTFTVKNGNKGTTGAAGKSVTKATQTTSSTESGGMNVVTFYDSSDVAIGTAIVYNGKATEKLATQTVDGLMSSTDKKKLDNMIIKSSTEPTNQTSGYWYKEY